LDRLNNKREFIPVYAKTPDFVESFDLLQSGGCVSAACQPGYDLLGVVHETERRNLLYLHYLLT